MARSRAVTKIRHRVPVEEYLRPQKRFAHLFGAPGHPEMLAQIQADADRNIRRFGLLDERSRGMTMDKPFAITLDPGSSLANKTGTWRTERPVYVDRLPPCNAHCPAGEDIQGWLFHAEGGDYEAAWRHLTRDNPFPAIMGRVCYHTLRGGVQPRPRSTTAVGINSVERFLGDEALKQRLDVRAAGAAEIRQARAGGRRRAVGHVGGLPPAAARPPRHGDGGRAAAGRHDALRHPASTACRATCSTPRCSASSTMGVHARTQHQGRATSRRRDGEGGFDAAFLAVGAHIAKRAFIPAKDRRASSTRCRCCARWKARTSRCSAAAWSSTAAATPRSTSRAPPSGWAPPRPSSSTAARARRCRRTTSRSRRRCEEGVMVKWLSTIKQADDAGALTIEKMVLDAKGNPQPTGEFETLEADSLVLALGQDVDLSLLDGVPGLAVKDGVVQVDPATMMTGHAGPVRRRRHGAGRAQRDGGRGPRQEGRAPHRRLAARHGGCGPEPKHAPASFERLNPWYYSDAPEDGAPAARPRPPHQQLRRGARRPDRGQRPVRGPPLPELRQLLRVRQLLRRVPRQRRHQARPRQALRSSTSTTARAAASASPSAPAARSRWCPRTCRPRPDGKRGRCR